MKLYNTKTRKIEELTPLSKEYISMYHCGPTVYDYAHIGNLRSFVFADTLRRACQINGFDVKQVMNITDIGHLTDDGSHGDDKMVKAIKREGQEFSLKGLRHVADFYANALKEDLKKLHILPAHEYPYASDHIQEQIELIERLEKKGHTYTTSDGVYFSTESDPSYGVLGGLADEGDEKARIEEQGEKKDRRDFALWKFSDNEIGWTSPWGLGFPGWHIECSAMSMKYLGESFDIHTGGIDHISIHHNNEIAQSECATGKEMAQIWMHNAFLNMTDFKMSKSTGNTLTLRTLEEKKISPSAYRLLLLQAHYRSPLEFSWEALQSVETAYTRLKTHVSSLPASEEDIENDYTKELKEHLSSDLQTPKAIALLFSIEKDALLSDKERYSTYKVFDTALGLGLFEKEIEREIPDHIKDIAKERDNARENKEWQLSDTLRDQIQNEGFEVSDTKEGTVVK
ncbi:MAG: cysteinyl-tRNA synthetase [Flavobacteriaceae bacterium]|jgi:cysteinyl-tRNA synthetase